MILLIPYTKFTLKTYLSTYEAEQKLAAHVEPRKLRWGLSRNHKFFTGTLENGKFNLNRIIHYRNSFLPIIVGQIHDDLDTSRIEITMRLHYFVMVFMALFLLFWLFITGSFFLPSDVGDGGAFPIATFFGFIFLFYGISMAFFNYEANKARRHLEEIFSGRRFKPGMSSAVSRVKRSKAQARANYNRLSRWYDIIAGNTERKYRDIGLAKLNARQGESVLEIGYGTGHSLLALAQAVGENGRITGIDISDGMYTIAHNRIQKAGLANRIELHIADALTHPFPTHSFSAIFMSFTLELFDTPEIPILLQQCYDWLQPNGRIVIVSLIKKPGTAVHIYEWFHKKMPTAIDCRPINAQSDLALAGFVIEDTTALSMWGLPVAVILARKNN